MVNGNLVKVFSWYDNEWGYSCRLVDLVAQHRADAPRRRRGVMRKPRSVREADVADKVVLVRADLNVPLEDGRVADDTRIRASLPTLELLLDSGASEVRVCSHLGRPKSEEDKAKYAIAPVAARLRELLPDDRVTVLENTRFDAGETKNDEEYARELADGCDLYVNDAFGSAHRAHSSTEAVAHLLPAYAGLLMLDELEHLGRLLGDVERPFVLISGGAKVEDKLGVLRNLGGRADTVLIGGKMAEELRDREPARFPGFELPVDVVGAAEFAADAESRVCGYDELPGRLARSRHRAGDARQLRRGACIARARSSGMGRWASSSGRASPPGRKPSPKRSPRTPTRSPSSAAPTPSAR